MNRIPLEMDGSGIIWAGKMNEGIRIVVRFLCMNPMTIQVLLIRILLMCQLLMPLQRDVNL